MNRLKVLVVYPGRFGFHVVSYFLCKYGAQKHDFTYLGLAFAATAACETSTTPPGVTVKNHSCQSGLSGRREVLRLLREEVMAGHYDVVFTAYIPGLSLLRRFFAKQDVKVIVDIRSGFLVKNGCKRFLLNRMLRYECRQFHHITINSNLLAKYLGFAEGEVTELPLGAEPVSVAPRDFTRLHLLYVGALSKRRVEVTVAGLRHYMNSRVHDDVAKYDIVGAGSPDEVQIIRTAIVANKLQEVVEMHGYVPRERIAHYLRNATVGVSFVPITPYYDLQPVTKTYEFLLAGLPVLATSTTQNKCLVNEANGVLIEDTAESFSRGLAEISKKLPAFDPLAIQGAARRHSWESVILGHYLSFIENNIGHKGFTSENHL
jgi:glycosyltransferase involved in cell wall biosynthesis